MHSLCCKCTEMQNILLCNVIDKTAAKYFTQAKYFTVYYETTTTKCSLCTLYVVNVEECKIFHSSTNINKLFLAQNCKSTILKFFIKFKMLETFGYLTLLTLVIPIFCPFCSNFERRCIDFRVIQDWSFRKKRGSGAAAALKPKLSESQL